MAPLFIYNSTSGNLTSKAGVSATWHTTRAAEPVQRMSWLGSAKRVDLYLGIVV